MTEGGITITTKMVTTLVAVITLLTVMFGGISTVNSFTYRVEKLETERVELLAEIKLLNAKLDVFSSKLVDLTITMNRVEDRYKLTQERGRVQ